jgi:hypothetical protein
MSLQEIFTNLRNLWLLLFVFICVYRFCTQPYEKKEEKPIVPTIIPETEQLIQEVEKDIEKKEIEQIQIPEPETIAPKPIKKVRPIVSWDYQKLVLEMEIIDLR